MGFRRDKTGFGCSFFFHNCCKKKTGEKKKKKKFYSSQLNLVRNLSKECCSSSVERRPHQNSLMFALKKAVKKN